MISFLQCIIFEPISYSEFILVLLLLRNLKTVIDYLEIFLMTILLKS